MVRREQGFCCFASLGSVALVKKSGHRARSFYAYPYTRQSGKCSGEPSMYSDVSSFAYSIKVPKKPTNESPYCHSRYMLSQAVFYRPCGVETSRRGSVLEDSSNCRDFNKVGSKIGLESANYCGTRQPEGTTRHGKKAQRKKSRVFGRLSTTPMSVDQQVWSTAGWSMHLALEKANHELIIMSGENCLRSIVALWVYTQACQSANSADDGMLSNFDHTSIT